MSVQTLFDPNILAQYSVGIESKLAGHRIMTKCDYLKYMKPPTTFLNLYTLIDSTKELCTGVIPYAKSCLTACVIGDKQCDKYNALFLVNPHTGETVGFVIIQKGECNTYPNMISIKLICSSIRGGGHILLGAVAYCIKLSAFEQGIILDLAGGTLNDRALKSYQRFGFVDSEKLRDSGNCYPTGKGNLIMLLDLRSVSPDNIFYKVLGSAPTNLMNPGNDPHLSEEPLEVELVNKRDRNENERSNERSKRARGGKRKTRRRTRRRTRRKN